MVWGTAGRNGPSAPAPGEIWGHTFKRWLAQPVWAWEGQKTFCCLKRKAGGVWPGAEKGILKGEESMSQGGK